MLLGRRATFKVFQTGHGPPLSSSYPSCNRVLLITATHDIVVSSHGQDTGGCHVREVVQGSGTYVSFEHLLDAALGEDAVLARLDLQA